MKWNRIFSFGFLFLLIMSGSKDIVAQTETSTTKSTAPTTANTTAAATAPDAASEILMPAAAPPPPTVGTPLNTIAQPPKGVRIVPEGLPPASTVSAADALAASPTSVTQAGPASPSLATGQAPMLTLEDAIFLSLRYSPLVRNAEIQRIVDKFNLRLAQYSYELQYALTGNLNYSNTTVGGFHSEATTYNLTPAVNWLSPIGTQITVSGANNFSHSIGQQTFFNPLVTATVVQPLIRGYGPAVTLAPLYNAYDQELIARLTLRNVVITDITTVITQYTALVQAKNTLKALQLSLETTLNTLKQYKAEIQAGRRAPGDTVQFQVNVAQQQLAIEAQLVTIQQAQLTLMQTLGLDPTIPISVPAKIDMNDKNLPDLKRSIELTLQNDITYQQQKLSLRVLQRQLMVQRDQQRWQLDATFTQTFGGGAGGGVNSGFGSIFNGQNKSTAIGLQLNVPIHNIALQAGLVQAKVALDQAIISLAAQKRAVIANAINAYNTLISQKQQITQAQKAVELANLNLNNANIRLNYGRSTPFEVGSLQIDLTNAQISLINTVISYDNSLAAYEQTLGITLDRWGVKLRC